MRYHHTQKRDANDFTNTIYNDDSQFYPVGGPDDNWPIVTPPWILEMTLNHTRNWKVGADLCHFFCATAKVFSDSPHDHLYSELHPRWLWDCSTLCQSVTACQPKWGGNKMLLIEAWEFPPNGHLMQWNHRRILVSAVKLQIICGYWSKGSHLFLMSLSTWMELVTTTTACRVEAHRGCRQSCHTAKQC